MVKEQEKAMGNQKGRKSSCPVGVYVVFFLAALEKKFFKGETLVNEHEFLKNE